MADHCSFGFSLHTFLWLPFLFLWSSPSSLLGVSSSWWVYRNGLSHCPSPPPKSWAVSKGLKIWWQVLFTDGHFIQSGALRIVTEFIYGHEENIVLSALGLLSWEDVVGAVRSSTDHLIVRTSVQNKACLRQAEWDVGGTDSSHHH